MITAALDHPPSSLQTAVVNIVRVASTGLFQPEYAEEIALAVLGIGLKTDGARGWGSEIGQLATPPVEKNRMVLAESTVLQVLGYCVRPVVPIEFMGVLGVGLGAEERERVLMMIDVILQLPIVLALDSLEVFLRACILSLPSSSLVTLASTVQGAERAGVLPANTWEISLQESNEDRLYFSNWLMDYLIGKYPGILHKWGKDIVSNRILPSLLKCEH